jgi:RHS repeat-associated protein
VASTTAPYYTDGSSIYTTTYEYDALDRPTASRFPDTNSVTHAYGLWRTETRDEHGHLTAQEYDAFGRKVVQEQHHNTETLRTTFNYNLLGQMVEMKDPVGNTWSWTWDSLGRNKTKTDPDAGTWTFEHDDAGRLVTQKDAKTPPQETTFAYDVAGRLQTKTNASGTVTITRSETRPDAFNRGRVTTVSGSGTTLKTDYDGLGRPITQVRTLEGVDYTARRRYDAAGRLLGITYPDYDEIGTTGAPIGYDGAGRLRLIPGILGPVLYNASGQPVQQTNANGTTTTRTFSAQRGFLTGITTSPGIQGLTYAPDQAGMITQVTSAVADEGWSYGYDDLHRLTSATDLANPTNSQAFEYNSIGNITYNSRVGTYTYPPVGASRPHAPVTAGSNTFPNYDANGNLVAGGGRTLVWNADNRPTQINTTTFVYDGLGDRLKKTSGGTTSLYPFGDDYEVTNGTVTKYVKAAALGVVAKRVGTGGGATTFWLHTDRLGSIQAITDASGALVQRRTYRPYGDKIADSGPGNVESRGYIDQRQDAETGLTYLHARYYDSALGIFLSPDPIGADPNGYRYASGNPTNRIDPSGLVDGCGEWTDNSATVCADLGYGRHGGGSSGGEEEIVDGSPQGRPGDEIGGGGTEPPPTPPTPGGVCATSLLGCDDPPGGAGTGTGPGTTPEPPKPNPAPAPAPPPPPGTIFQQANTAQTNHFGPGWDPYNGGYRHCFAGCTLRREYWPLGSLYMWGWDLTHELYGPHRDWTSPGDMTGERRGWDLGPQPGQCDTLCLGPYPPYRP